MIEKETARIDDVPVADSAHIDVASEAASASVLIGLPAARQ
jgi:hypothetical protein